MTASAAVNTTQEGPHQGLGAVLVRHADTTWRAPCPEHTRRAFDPLHRLVERTPRPVVLDLGCGTGESTIALAAQHTSCWVFGLDRSEHRLRRARDRSLPTNARFVRCDAAHFCSLACAANWDLHHLYFLYPNPYPKPGHLRRRWHAHPVFPTLARLQAGMELRTNWDLYAREFEMSLGVFGRQAECRSLEHMAPISAFERKYLGRGERCVVVRSPSRGKLEPLSAD